MDFPTFLCSKMSISTSLSKNWSFGWFTSLSLSAQTRFKLPPFLVDGVWADQLVNSRFVLLLQCWSVLLHHFCLLFCPRPLWCCFVAQMSLPCKLRCGFANPLFVVCLLFHIHLWCFGPVLSKWHLKSKSHYIKKCFWCEMFPFMHPSKIDSLSTFSCIILFSVNFQCFS